MIKIKKPYKNALTIPDFLELAFLVKKETVSGIIGNTQGVSSAINPPKNPIKNKLDKLLDLVSLLLVDVMPQLFFGC
jgi:hypothetical protein